MHKNFLLVKWKKLPEKVEKPGKWLYTMCVRKKQGPAELPGTGVKVMEKRKSLLFQRIMSLVMAFLIFTGCFAIFPGTEQVQAAPKNGIVLEKKKATVYPNDRVTIDLNYARMYQDGVQVLGPSRHNIVNGYDQNDDSAGMGHYYREFTYDAVKFSSSNKKVATVTSKGVVTAKKAGTAKITVRSKYDSRIKGTFTVTVKKVSGSIQLKKSSTTLYKGKRYAVKVRSVKGLKSKKVTYKSSNSSVATVNSKGVVTAKKKGTAYITVTSSSNKKVKAVFTVTVKQPVTAIQTAPTLTVKKGSTVKLNTVVAPSNASSKKLTYRSSNKKVVTVSSSGRVKGIKTGTATVTIKSADGYVTKKVRVTVKNNVKKATAVKLNKTRLTLKRTESYRLKATVSPSGATVKDVYWVSADSSIAEVDQNGVVTAKNYGGVAETYNGGMVSAVKSASTMIYAYAKDGSGKVGKCKVTVKPKTVTVYIEEYSRVNPDILQPGDEYRGTYRLVNRYKERMVEGISIAKGRYGDDDHKPDKKGYYEENYGDHTWLWKDVKAKEGAVLKVYVTWNGNDDGSY